MKAIVTMPPYAPFMDEVARHPMVSGLRLNTVMPVVNPLEDVLNRFKDTGQEIYIDLKGRQLRTAESASPPFTEITLSHDIELSIDPEHPPLAYFRDGRDKAHVVAVKDNKLIMLEGPRETIGKGESINILDPSLVIHGGLTEKDKAYIAAGRAVGIHNYMLSFVESSADAQEVSALDTLAQVVEKIESRKGGHYVRDAYSGNRLMLARGDYFIEVGKPHKILRATKEIITADPNAIAASRIFTSLSASLEPACSDISDVAYLHELGYKTIMLGDDVCQRRDSVISALNLLEAMNL